MPGRPRPEAALLPVGQPGSPRGAPREAPRRAPRGAPRRAPKGRLRRIGRGGVRRGSEELGVTLCRRRYRRRGFRTLRRLRKCSPNPFLEAHSSREAQSDNGDLILEFQHLERVAGWMGLSFVNEFSQLLEIGGLSADEMDLNRIPSGSRGRVAGYGTGGHGSQRREPLKKFVSMHSQTDPLPTCGRRRAQATSVRRLMRRKCQPYNLPGESFTGKGNFWGKPCRIGLPPHPGSIQASP